MRSFTSDPSWGFRSVSFWMVALIAAGLLFIGIRFLAMPSPAARDFGISLQSGEDLAFGRIKGVRDVFCASTLILLLWSGQRRLCAWIFGTAIVIPFTDGLLVLLHNGPTDAAHIAVHWGTVVFCTVALWLLARKQRKVPAR